MTPFKHQGLTVVKGGDLDTLLTRKARVQLKEQAHCSLHTQLSARYGAEMQLVLAKGVYLFMYFVLFLLVR